MIPEEIKQRAMNKIYVIREHGKCCIKKFNFEKDDFDTREITEEEFLEYKKKYYLRVDCNCEYSVLDYNDTSDRTNPNIFTYTWDELEKNIVKDKVVSFQKCLDYYTGKEARYIITLLNNDKVLLPNEDIYNSFCKWMKGEK